MTLDEASKIIRIWGVWLEYSHGKLLCLFGGYIPESFLPFPKETLEEGLNIVAEQQHNAGNQDMVKDLQRSIAILLFYKDDEEAMLQTIKLWNDSSLREVKLSAFKKFQKDWIKTQSNINSDI